MKYDAAHIEPLIQSLTDGEGRVRACNIANITHETFMNWMSEYSEFSDSVKKAEAIGNDRIKDLQKRKIIENTSWQSGAWWLERRYPDEYKNRTETKLEGPLKIVIDSDDANL